MLSIEPIKYFLSFMQEVVIMHWACSKLTVSSAIPDATLLEILLDKVVQSFIGFFSLNENAIIIHMQIQCLTVWDFQLKLCRSISYAAVAAHADQTGRRKLAAMLVEHEPLSSKQVAYFCHGSFCLVLVFLLNLMLIVKFRHVDY